MGTWIELAIDWVIARVQDWGYGGIFVMMTIESSFVPFPSEVALIPAGYLAAQGEMNPAVAAGIGTLGSLLGAFINYGLALWLGRPFVERVLRMVPGVSPAQLATSERFFARHGEITIFVGRLIPAIRQLISLPAGLVRMNLFRFTLYTGLGAGIWSAILVALGFWAGGNEEAWRPLLRTATVGLLLGAGGLIAGYVLLHRWGSRVA